jgi:hypothetical protein
MSCSLGLTQRARVHEVIDLANEWFLALAAPKDVLLAGAR